MQKKAPEMTKPVPAEFDFAQYRISNPEEFSRNMQQRRVGLVLSGGNIDREMLADALAGRTPAAA